MKEGNWMLSSLVEDFPIHEPKPNDSPTVLDGVRVVDFSHFLAGPLATMLLADLGADVIKVEPPVRGDTFRYYPPELKQLPSQGAPFVYANRNKRSIALDLKTDAGLQIVRELIKDADVLVENFSYGVMSKLGLDYSTCAKLNPRLIYCSVSAFGRNPEFADKPGFDPVAQAESGFLSMNGYSDREGVRTLSPVIDITTASIVSSAVLAALLARERSGKGQYVEASLFHTGIHMTGYASMQHLFSNAEVVRHGNTSPDSCPSGLFRCKDRAFYINCGNDKIFKQLMQDVLGETQLALLPRFQSNAGRIAHRAELFSLLEASFATQSWQELQKKMRKASIPCGEVRSVGEALRSVESRTEKIVSRIPHPVIGWVPNIAPPFRLSSSPFVDPIAAPALGQHTREILGTVLGYDDEQFELLKARGAFGDASISAGATEGSLT